jgi:hypothetical protein
LSVAWGPACYAYSANYLIDVAAGIVVDVEATPAHKIDEINATKTMIERVEDRFWLKPDCLIGDTNYGTAQLLGWMVEEKHIEPHVPVWDKTQRHDDTLSSTDFPGRRIPLPAGPCAAQSMAPIQEPAYPHNQGRHHHLSIQPSRLCDLPDEGSLLSEYTDSEDRSQRPRICTGRRSRHRQDQCLQTIAQGSQEGRDALRSPRADSEA